MPIIVDNNFSQDSYRMRAVRLQAVQNNFEIIRTLPGLPENPESWARDCFSRFVAAWDRLEDAKADKKNATRSVSERFDEMKSLYGKFVLLADALAYSDVSLRKTFKLDQKQPRKILLFAERVAYTLRIFPSNSDRFSFFPKINSLVRNLADAKEEFYKALDYRELKKLESASAARDLSELMKKDKINLKAVKALAIANYSEFDLFLEQIGVATPKYKIYDIGLAAPGNFHFESKRFSWDAVREADGYQLAFKSSSRARDWEEAYAGADTSVVFDPGEGVWEFKVRARNSHGFGAFSKPIKVDLS